MKDKKDHIHSYERIRGKTGSNTRYRCIDPDCTHVTLMNLLPGKRAICSICHLNEILITPEDLRRKHFRCLDCSNTKAAAETREKKAKVASILNNVFVDQEDDVDWFKSSSEMEDIVNEG